MQSQFDFVINITLMLFLASSLLFFIQIIFKKKIFGILGLIMLGLGIAGATFALILRWKIAGHIPLSNTYETMITLAWMTGIGYIFLYKIDSNKILAFTVSIIIVLVLAFTSLIDDNPRPLIPALQSNWLTVHVLFCFIGYAAFAISFGVSIIYLIFNNKINMNLERVIYKTILLGVPFLTLGIVTGAIWANRAWGRYWGWDPKETWSLITWFIYTIYLHSRYLKGWKGRKTAWLSIAGFLFVLFTYFGVNYILAGLHSYSN